MKKKLLLAVLSLCGVIAFAGCNFSGATNSGSEQSGNSESVENSSTTSDEVTITFVQNGQPDVKKTINKGEDLTDIPTPVEKEGYTVVWETVDLTNVQESMTVDAVETANTYTITYDVNGGDELTETTQDVTYDATYTLATPTKDGFTFVAWKDADGNSLTLSGVWKIAGNVTLTADWLEDTPETVTITFVQNGQPNVTKTINKGENLTDIPTPVAKKGYTVVWETVDLTNVQESMTVDAVETANTYTITYNVNGGDELTKTTQDVKYGATYTMVTPTRTGYKFLGWYIKNTDTKFENGTWNTDGNVELEAKWEKDDGEWTKNY